MYFVFYSNCSIQHVINVYNYCEWKICNINTTVLKYQHKLHVDLYWICFPLRSQYIVELQHHDGADLTRPCHDDLIIGLIDSLIIKLPLYIPYLKIERDHYFYVFSVVHKITVIQLFPYFFIINSVHKLLVKVNNLQLTFESLNSISDLVVTG